MTAYEYSSFAMPLAHFREEAIDTMNYYGSVGWHIFHLHEVIREGVPSMVIYMARKLEERGDEPARKEP